MRQISGQHLVFEIAEDTFTLTPRATALATNSALENVCREFYHGVNTPIFSSPLCFLKGTRFKNPTNLNNGNWQYKKSTTNNFVQDLTVNPAIPLTAIQNRSAQSL